MSQSDPPNRNKSETLSSSDSRVSPHPDSEEPSPPHSKGKPGLQPKQQPDSDNRIQELEQQLNQSEEQMALAQQRLEALLETKYKIASLRDKFIAVVHASNAILREIPLQHPVEVAMYFRETGATGQEGFAYFHMQTESVDPDHIQLRQDRIQDIVHDYFPKLPPFIEDIIQLHGALRCSVSKDTLSVPLSYNSLLQGFIQVTGVDVLQLSEDDKSSVNTLSHFLALSLANLSFTLELEQRVEDRTKQLHQSLEQLEEKNTALSVSYQRLEDLHQTNQNLLRRLGLLHQYHLKSLEEWLDSLLNELQPGEFRLARNTLREIHKTSEILQPVAYLFSSGQAIRDKRVLLAENNKKAQIIAKLALGGTGVTLDIVEDEAKGRMMLEQHRYDILCVNSDLIRLAVTAQSQHPRLHTVLITSDDPSTYLPILRKHSFLSNIVARSAEDRTFTLKNIFVTVCKLVSNNIFGLEKYLSWGVEVHQHSVVSSRHREDLVEKMEDDLRPLGIRRPQLAKCKMVAEELLMNAIYDAPVDPSGQRLYNNASRTIQVILPPDHQGLFRYACDGMLLALSVSDPFGSLERDDILSHLQSCYDGSLQDLHQKQGGAGLGLYQIMEIADLVVINVKPHIKTEVIAIFNIDPNRPKTNKNTSFHHFYG